MAKKNRGKLPLSIAAGVGIPMYTVAIEPILAGDVPRMQRQVNYYAFGRQEDGSGFQLSGPAKFYGPMIMGIAAHKVIGKRINPYLPSWLPVSF